MNRPTLYHRYRQLSIWNKLGVWGSVASVVGLSLYFLSAPDPSIRNTSSLLWSRNSTVIQAGRDAVIYDSSSRPQLPPQPDSPISPFFVHGEMATYHETLRSADLDIVAIDTVSKSVAFYAEYHWMAERYPGYAPWRMEMRLIRREDSGRKPHHLQQIHTFLIKLKDGFRKTVTFDVANFEHDDLEDCRNIDKISLGRVLTQFNSRSAPTGQEHSSIPDQQEILSDMFSHFIIATQLGYFPGGVVTIVKNDPQRLATDGGLLATLHDDSSRRVRWWQFWKRG